MQQYCMNIQQHPPTAISLNRINNSNVNVADENHHVMGDPSSTRHTNRQYLETNVPCNRRHPSSVLKIGIIATPAVAMLTTDA
jgi:hypothetical protein